MNSSQLEDRLGRVERLLADVAERSIEHDRYFGELRAAQERNSEQIAELRRAQDRYQEHNQVQIAELRAAQERLRAAQDRNSEQIAELRVAQDRYQEHNQVQIAELRAAQERLRAAQDRTQEQLDILRERVDIVVQRVDESSAAVRVFAQIAEALVGDIRGLRLEVGRILQRLEGNS